MTTTTTTALNNTSPPDKAKYFKTNDGEFLFYQEHGDRKDPTLILIHGFTGSSEYFTRNYTHLSKKYHIIAPDLRGHGFSQTKAKRSGYHVSRLAADLNDLIMHMANDGDDEVLEPKTETSRDDDNRIQRESVMPLRLIGVGCSLGAAVLWSYTEIYTSSAFQAMIFVDQAPLQNYIPDSWDSSQGNYGVHDEATLAVAVRTLLVSPEVFYRGLVDGCLGYRFAPDEEDGDRERGMGLGMGMVGADVWKTDEDFFVGISCMGDGWWFGKLLSDHTGLDHRDVIRDRLLCPCLVMAGKRSGSFPVKGVEETVKLINGDGDGDGDCDAKMAEMVVMDSGHWMFYEEPDLWSQHIIGFADKVFDR